MLKSNKRGPKKPENIYMDYAASALPNPSSIHRKGAETKKKLEEARRNVAEILSARPGEIIFTSGGTESNNLAIQGLIYGIVGNHFLRSSEKIPRPFQNAYRLSHIITTNIEHPSVLETCKLLEDRNMAEVTVVPVEANGIVDPKKIKKEIKENTVLVSVMYANNEIGTIQPIAEIAKEIRHYKKTKSYKPEAISCPFFHTDAVQGINYLDLNVARLGVDMLSLSGAKVEGGPARNASSIASAGGGRVGLLYKKSGIPLQNIFGGGDQEFGLRPGTENWPEILKFATAFTEAQKIKDKESVRLVKLRDYFITSITQTLDVWVPDVQRLGVIINGDLENRLPNNVNITFPKVPSDLLVVELSARGIMASSKSACKSSKAEGSYVIRALRPEADPEIGGLRFSFGRDTKKEDVSYVVKSLKEILKKLEKWYH